jgi:hypothetical protein
MKVKDTTNPELAKLVYIRNTSIKGYDTAAGPAAPASHSLPETKLPSVPEYAGMQETGGSKHGAVRKLSSYRTKSNKGDSRSSLGSQSRAADDSFDQGRKVSGDDLEPMTRAAATADSGELMTAPQDVTATVETKEGVASGHEPKATSRSTAASPTGRRADKKQAATAAEVVAAELQKEAEEDDTCYDDDTSITGDCGLKTPALANVLRYALKHLLRVYPSGKRMLDNSNPSPMPSWAVGASLAALNWQLADEPMWINEAFFARQDNW